MELEESMSNITTKLQKRFVEGCYEGYDVLTSMGKSALIESEIPAIKKAINRMNTLFLMREEYERCGWLKRFCEEHLPEHKIEIDEEVQNQLII